MSKHGLILVVRACAVRTCRFTSSHCWPSALAPGARSSPVRVGQAGKVIGLQPGWYA
jgi:hypothetical protein